MCFLADIAVEANQIGNIYLEYKAWLGYYALLILFPFIERVIELIERNNSVK